MKKARIFIASFLLTAQVTSARAIDSAPSRSYFERGVDELERFKPDAAIRNFSRALLATPNPTRKFRAMVFLEIGRALQADENEIAALQSLSIAHALNPSDQSITAYYADSLCRCGERARGKKLFEQLKVEKVKTLATLENLSFEASREADFDQAMSYLKEARRLPEGAKDAHLALLFARLLSRQGKSTQSGAEFHRASQLSSSPYIKHMAEAMSYRIAGKSQEQIKELKEAGKVLPDEPTWHSELAECYATAGNLRDALDHHNLAMQGRVSSRSFQRACAYLRNQKRYQDALNVAAYLGKLKPWSSESAQAAGAIYLAKKDYKNAEIELKKAISMDKYVEQPYTDLARCYSEQSQFDKARQVYEQALVNCPKSLATMRRMANLDMQLGDETSARRGWERIIAQVKDIQQVNVLVQNEVAVAYAKLGALYYRDKNFDEALKSAQLFNRLKFVPALPPMLTIVKMRPGHLEAGTTAAEKEYNNHICLADMLREGGRLDDCIAELRKAEALNSDDVDLHSYLLSALDEKGDMVGTAKEDVILSTKLVNKVPAAIKHLTDKKPSAQ